MSGRSSAGLLLLLLGVIGLSMFVNGSLDHVVGFLFKAPAAGGTEVVTPVLRTGERRG